MGEGHGLVRGGAGGGARSAPGRRARGPRGRAAAPRARVPRLYRAPRPAPPARRPPRAGRRHLAGTVGADDRLQALTFHAWCSRELRRAKVAMPPAPERGQAWHEYWERVPALLLDAYVTGQARTGTYQAILVDEGQDFANDWYRVILKALDPASNSLFVAVDSSQNIYQRKISWRELGVQIVGHTRVLRVNYRNTRPILNAAYRVISDLDSSSNMSGEQADDYVTPDRALRDGPPPQVHRHASLAVARRFAQAWIQ